MGAPGKVDAPTPDPEAPEFWAAAVVGVDAVTGMVRWATAVDAAPSVPVVDGDTVVVTFGGDTLLALDLSTGERLWERELPGQFPATLTAENGVVVASSLDSTRTTLALLAFRTEDGEPIWESDETIAERGTPFPGGAVSYAPTGPSIGAGVVVYGRSEPSAAEIRQEVVALDAETGEPRWTARTEAYFYDPPTIAGDTVYVQGGNGVRAFNAGTGEERWQFINANDLAITQPVTVADGVVYAGGPSDQLYAIEAVDGTLLWRVLTAEGVAAPVAVSGGVVLVPVGTGRLVAIGPVSAEPTAATPSVDTSSTVDATPSSEAPGDDPPLIDVTGLPACDVPPRPELERGRYGAIPPSLDGPPAVTLAEPEWDEYGLLRTPVLPPEDIPDGEAVDDATLAAIGETFADMNACARLNPDRASLYDIQNFFLYGNEYAALFTDDFFRRDWVRERLRTIGYDAVVLYVSAPGEPISAVGLPDGRVAVVAPATNGRATTATYVLAEVDGRWLVDEYLESESILP